MISVDSSGWIERLSGGPKASAYRRIIDAAAPAEIVTSVVAVYEVYKKIKRAKGELAALEAVAALGQTRVIPVDQELALEAADYSLSLGLHFADALVYATAQRYQATLYTSDRELSHAAGVTTV
ncbi:MAG TPA: type II toxin-antitoxin system VapC family toxin [Thermoplasmata archaeon]|nr:type II toxin-antitoxin system VapC family toxin [Thermoplasmata archaeon]